MSLRGCLDDDRALSRTSRATSSIPSCEARAKNTIRALTGISGAVATTGQSYDVDGLHAQSTWSSCADNTLLVCLLHQRCMPGKATFLRFISDAKEAQEQQPQHFASQSPPPAKHYAVYYIQQGRLKSPCVLSYTMTIPSRSLSRGLIFAYFLGKHSIICWRA